MCHQINTRTYCHGTVNAAWSSRGSVSLIECLVDGEGPDPHENDVRVELHGNDEACDSARKGPDGPWEWYLPASLTSVVKVRGLHLFCNRSCLLHTRSAVHPLPLYRKKVVHLHSPGRAAGVAVAPTFASSKLLPIPLPYPSICVPYPPGARP